MELLLSQRENAGTKDLPCQGHRYQTSRSAPVSSRKINVEFWDPWLTRNFAFVLLMESTMSATTIIIMQKFKWIITQYAFCRHSYLTLLRIMWNMLTHITGQGCLSHYIFCLMPSYIIFPLGQPS